MTLHIGIVGCSAEGAALCYRTICHEGVALLGPYAHPEVSMHTPPLSAYVDCLARGDLDGVGDLMLASAEKLALAGTDLLVCPDNTIHQAWDRVAPRSPLPWLHIAEAVAEEAASHGFQRLAILGTKWLVESEVYPDKLGAQGIGFERPAPQERDSIDRLIMDELVNGVFRQETVAYFQGVIERMAGACDAVVLGCTEIPLIIDADNSALPVLDSTRILARAALHRAVADGVPSTR